MKIAICVNSLNSGNYLQHQVRGSGFYLSNLITSFNKYFPENEYILFDDYYKLPKDIDIVHIPTFEPFFMSLPIVKKYKYVVTIHDMIPFLFPNHFPFGVKGLVKWNFQKLLLSSYCDGIITDSLQSKKDIQKFTGISLSKIHSVLLAPSEEFRQIDKNKLEIIRRKFHLPQDFVLYVGDVTWNKNIPRIVDACIFENIPLVLVGKSIMRKDFDKNNSWNTDVIELQKKIEKHSLLHPLGFVETDDLVGIYNLSTALVMPSLYEGFGLPILEAMRSGCPVITSKEGSLPEIAGDAAYYVDPHNEKSISFAIKFFLNNKLLREEYRIKGLHQAEKFSWKNTAFETIQVYKEIVG